jgi:hypothetical protein
MVWVYIGQVIRKRSCGEERRIRRQTACVHVAGAGEHGEGCKRLSATTPVPRGGKRSTRGYVSGIEHLNRTKSESWIVRIYRWSLSSSTCVFPCWVRALHTYMTVENRRWLGWLLGRAVQSSTSHYLSVGLKMGYIAIRTIDTRPSVLMCKHLDITQQDQRMTRQRECIASTLTYFLHLQNKQQHRSHIETTMFLLQHEEERK